MSPVVLGGKTPLDFNMKFADKKPILGKGKTWRGSIMGIAAGTLIAYIQTIIQSNYNIDSLNLTEMTLTLGFLLSSGAIIGDIAKSFIKRRMNIERGKMLPILDQIDFVIGALIFASFATSIRIETVITLIIITPAVHRIANIIAYKLKLKKVPW